MNFIPRQTHHMDTTLTLLFSPIVLAFVIGALPVLVSILVVRGLSRLIGRHSHTTQ